MEQVGAIGTVVTSFYIALDGCEEASLYSVSKVQINTTKIITGVKKMPCSVWHREVWEVSCNTT